MLTDKYLSLKSEHENMIIVIERERVLYEKVNESFPLDIDASISIDSMGKTLIRAFIYLPQDAKAKVTRKVIVWLKRFIGEGKVERSFRKEEGTFMWKGVINKDDFEEIILIENAHAEKCTIKKVKKEVEVYETNCELVKE